MSKWLILGTDKTKDGIMKGFQRLNAARSREKLFKANYIIFVDDNGLTHDDINSRNLSGGSLGIMLITPIAISQPPIVGLLSLIVPTIGVCLGNSRRQQDLSESRQIASSAVLKVVTRGEIKENLKNPM
jgi:uncharacterized membrane protein